MKNIIFSTTRQWNPGDEFILMGVRRILNGLGVDHNPMIFNRHPDIRSSHQDLQLFKASRLPPDFGDREPGRILEANVKFGFFDNSLKPDMSCEFADWVILAGTPEWCSGKMADLYAQIRRHNLPVMILGVGGGCDIYDPSFREVIAKAKALTVREEGTLAAVRRQGFAPTLLPCPALLSAPAGREKQVGEVRRVGLIYQASRSESVIWNGFSDEAYASMLALFRALITSRRDLEFELVCHYSDEMPLARRDFPKHRIRYSFDAADYLDIYSDYDFVVGPRVHGIGVSASLGIPGAALTHDARGSTCAGFLATMLPVTVGASGLAAVTEAISGAAEKSRELANHKAATAARYGEIVQSALGDTHVFYDKDASSPVQPRRFALEDLAAVAEALQALRFGSRPNGAETSEADSRLSEIRERLINVEAKLNRVLSLPS